MKPITVIWPFLLFIFLVPVPSFGDAAAPAAQTPSSGSALGLDEILARIEERYSVTGFSARFHQTSVLKAMDITDTAKGMIHIKRPGKMRWEYESPETQTIISDGYQLWIFRPDDNQVLIGKAPDFFGDGKGASFLSDVRQMRNNFTITLQDKPDSDNHILKLVPTGKEMDIAEILLSISWTTFDIEEVITLNAYGDETKIVLDEITFQKEFDDQLFKFLIPSGVEVLQMAE